MPQLKTHRQADSDIREAALWYEERCAGLGGKFIDSVQNATGFIAENPLRNAVASTIQFENEHENENEDDYKTDVTHPPPWGFSSVKSLGTLILLSEMSVGGR